MKVLLVSANTELINMPVLPFGMACMGNAAKSAGHEVSQINLMAEPDALNRLRERINNFHPDIIGISVRNIDDQVSSQPRFLLEPIKEMVSICKSNPQAKIVLGGAGYSIFPREILEYLDVDWGIQGPGEHAFTMFLDRLAHNHDPADIPGFHCRSRSIANPPAARVDINAYCLPAPDKSLWSLELQDDQPLWLPFQTRRGCPLNCSYCSTATIEGRLIHKRSLEHTIDTLAGFAAGGFDHFFFCGQHLQSADHLCQTAV